MAAPHTGKPLVLVPACHSRVGDHAFHMAGDKYVEAVRLSGCQPLIVPTSASASASNEFDALLDLADGVLLTGSPSNVHPRHFGEDVHDRALPLDPDRDASTLPLIPRVLARGIPLLAICRGFQEVNVALGGSLYQAVQEAPGKMDHRDADDATLDALYGPAHDVDVVPGGILAGLLAGLPGMPRIRVNSLHGQGVNRLAPGLRVEATAPDGLVEAFTVAHAAGFNLGVQWHPEWQAANNPVSMRLFEAFGKACAALREHRRASDPQPR
jgi:putative glutamine amidotransferase